MIPRHAEMMMVRHVCNNNNNNNAPPKITPNYYIVGCQTTDKLKYNKHEAEERSIITYDKKNKTK